MKMCKAICLSSWRVTTVVLTLISLLTNVSCNTDVYLEVGVAGAEVQLPNNSIVPPTDITQTDGVHCCTSSNPVIGNWFHPNVNGGQSANVFSIIRSQCIELLLEAGRQITAQDEGVYTCNIQDSSGTMRTLFVGIYTSDSYQNSAGPVLPPVDPITLQIISPTSHYPPSFSLNCSSTSYPPTVVSWLLNGAEQLPVSSSSSQLVRDKLTTTYDNILSISDFSMTGRLTFTCIVNNTRGSQTAEVVIRAPSGPPTNLSITTPGSNDVTVRWDPPGNVLGYRVFYMNGSITNMVNATADSATLVRLLAGVQYIITVQAFADLPSAISNSVTITLEAPGPPTITAATPVSPTSINVTWTQSSPTDMISGYGISYSPVRRDCPQIESGQQVVDGGAVSQYTVSGLQEGVEYDITVQARGVQAFGTVSNSLRAVSLNAAPSGPPSNVTATSISSQPELQVTWSPPPCQHINSQAGISGYVVRYRRLDDVNWTVKEVNSPATTSTVIQGIVMLIMYEVQVAARNTAGLGLYSVSETASVSATTPGEVTSLTGTPDITSITVSWEPPVSGEGRGHITQYEVCYRPVGSTFSPVCATLIGEDMKRYRIQGLQIENDYSITVQAFIESLAGPMQVIVTRTSAIDQVQGVRVRIVGETSVNVTWELLDSLDVSNYQVYYTRGSKKRQANTLSVGANVTSALVTSLERGATYSFQVAAVVLVNNVLTSGPSSESTPDNTLSVSVNSGVIAGVLIALLVFLMCVAVVIILIVYYVWQKSRSGHFKVTARSSSIQLKPRPHRIPLPEFDNKPLLASAKPLIQQYPKDIVAEEGERVIFRPKVSGSPNPTIAWYRNGHMVSSDYAIEAGDDGCLTFVCVERKHAGTYRFTVSNNAGSVQGQVCLYVHTDNETTDGEPNSTGPPKVTTMSVPIEDFGTYVEDLHGDNNRGFRAQYYSLSNGEEGHEVKWAIIPENKPLNRFTNITAYDDNRVKLKPMAGRADCQHEYINASYMDGYFMTKKFIGTQGPMEVTLVDFWRLVWQVRPPIIVMITNLQEGTRVKCTQYWPEEKGQSSEYGPFKVAFLEQQVFADFTIRMFAISLTTKSQTPLKIIQYHYTSWPDHGVPEYVGPMLAFHRKITAEYRPNKGPMIVHCSAGVGRTGTFIAIDTALEQVENENSIDIPVIVTKLREQRMKSVQTDEQYVFIHDAVFESVTCGNTQIPGWELSGTTSRLGQVSAHTGKSGFQHQFEILAKVTPKHGSASTATAFQHPDKNRDMDHLPPERHRVILKAEYPDYIHASFANGYKKKKAFIIAQAPLSNTCRDFWKMVYERNCTSIVMLSGVEENGKEVCFRYWPESNIIQHGEFAVSALEQSIHDGYIERVLSVTDSKSGQTHCISQFQLNNWATVGKVSAPPSQHTPLLSIADLVLSLQKKSGAGPIVVHCNDTVGRSGLFCVAATLMECCKVEGLIDVFQVVKALRLQKTGAIPSVEHYQYIHELMLTFVDSDDHIIGAQML